MNSRLHEFPEAGLELPAAAAVGRRAWPRPASADAFGPAGLIVREPSHRRAGDGHGRWAFSTCRSCRSHAGRHSRGRCGDLQRHGLEHHPGPEDHVLDKAHRAWPMNLFQHVAQGVGDGSPGGLRYCGVPGHRIVSNSDVSVPTCGDVALKGAHSGAGLGGYRHDDRPAPLKRTGGFPPGAAPQAGCLRSAFRPAPPSAAGAPEEGGAPRERVSSSPRPLRPRRNRSPGACSRRSRRLWQGCLRRL